MFHNPDSMTKISRGQTMDIVMAQTPEIIPILLKNKMSCVGCLLACFHNITDAVIEHDLDEDDLFSQLRDAGIRIAA